MQPCRESRSCAAQGIVTKVKGFEDGLKEALLTKGPMTVSVDAGSESFRFYKRGIYNNTACHTVPVTGGTSLRLCMHCPVHHYWHDTDSA